MNSIPQALGNNTVIWNKPLHTTKIINYELNFMYCNDDMLNGYIKSNVETIQQEKSNCWDTLA